LLFHTFLRPLRLLAAALWLTVGVAAAQEPERPLDAIAQEWSHSLGLITHELAQPVLSRDRAARLLERLATMRSQAVALQVESEAQLAPLRQQAETLGPPPQEGEPPEADAIVEERRKINEGITTYDARVKQAALTISLIDDVTAKIKARKFSAKIDILIRRFPLPLAPSTLAVAAPEFFQHLAALARSPREWWRVLMTEQRQQEIFFGSIMFLALAIVLGLVIRIALRRWFGRDPTIAEPTYARRLAAGISEGVGSGVIPALIFGALLYRVRSEVALVGGVFADVLAAACITAIFLVIAYALPRAVLAPELPAWRLVGLSPANARAINRRVTFLACVFAVEMFFAIMSESFVYSLVYSDSFRSVFEFVVGGLEAAGVLALIQGRLWTSEPTGADAEPETAPDADVSATAPPSASTFWNGLRLLIGATIVTAVLAALLGYANLSSYLSQSLLASGVIVGVLFLLRGLCRELIGAALRSSFLQERLAVRHATRALIKFWLRALLDVVTFAVGLFLLLVLWGMPLADMWVWTKQALQGITIGDVTISIVDIVVALTIFVGAVVVVRMLQRLLAERVLPQTKLDAGLRHSLSAGFGYMGLIIAGALGIAAMGLDLTNLALIFGALSVGIGFGLQGVVNNFVSGMILLIERPIKVGDWVVVGVNEGYVKSIRLRATELETFQRASIVIPNSEIVSTAVVNWTHKDRYGRVDVPVSVAYGSNIEQVKDILMTCLKENKEIVAWPAPRVLFRRFGESALDFEARGFLSNIENIYLVQSDLLTAIDAAFREAGIEIPFPQRDLHVRNIEGLAEAVASRRPEREDTAPAPRPARLSKVEGGEGDDES
jgi:small-conductance mechanosensitive channel